MDNTACDVISRHFTGSTKTYKVLCRDKINCNKNTVVFPTWTLDLFTWYITSRRLTAALFFFSFPLEGCSFPLNTKYRYKKKSPSHIRHHRNFLFNLPSRGYRDQDLRLVSSQIFILYWTFYVSEVNLTSHAYTSLSAALIYFCARLLEALQSVKKLSLYELTLE